MKNKLLYYVFGLIISFFVLLGIVFLYTRYINGVLYFWAFMIALAGSLLGGLVWQLKYKDKFEIFLVCVSYFLFSTLFVYLGPVTIDRSLSSFVYFYSVEKGNISTDIFDEKYFKEFVNRRFEDGVALGFLDCNNSKCTPKLKTKVLYYTLYPLAKVTGTHIQYRNFAEFLNNKQ